MKTNEVMEWWSDGILRYDLRKRRSATGFQTCRIADFQVGSACGVRTLAAWPTASGFGNPRHRRLGNLRYKFASRVPAPYTNLQSQRDCVSQPRVARNELPWVHSDKDAQPQRGCGHTRGSCCMVPQPLQGCIHCSPFPRVARSSQPWTLGRNPVGILSFFEPRQIGVRSRFSRCTPHSALRN